MISWNQLERRTDPLVLPVIALVVVLGLGTCPKIYQYTWYWPRIAHPMLALLCGEWNALGEIERDLFRLWVPYAGS